MLRLAVRPAARRSRDEQPSAAMTSRAGILVADAVLGHLDAADPAGMVAQQAFDEGAVADFDGRVEVGACRARRTSG